MLKKKNARDYWYSDVDIMQLLMEKSENHKLYKVVDSAVYNNDMDINNSLPVKLRVEEAIDFLQNDTGVCAAVIPINIGNKNNEGEWEGRHWVGLVICRIQQESEKPVFEALYCDSAASDDSQVEIPDKLKQQIILAGVDNVNIHDLSQHQQDNSYDCGPWTVFNLDHIARHGDLPIEKIDPSFILTQRNSLLPYYDDSSDEENDTKTIYKSDFDWLRQKLDSGNNNDLMSNSDKLALRKEDLKLSFLLHEVAIRVLKSQEVNGKYYPYKAKKLQKTLELRKEDFDQNMIETISKTLLKDYGVKTDIVPAVKQMLKSNPALFLTTQKTVKEENNYLTIRKTLSEDISFDKNYNAQDWLVYIRLFNCSGKRTAKNYGDNKDKFKDEDTYHINFRLHIPSIKQELSLGYKIYKNGTKVALVDNIGSYKIIKQSLLNITNSFKISDKQIACMVLDVLNNNLHNNDLYIQELQTNQKKAQNVVKYIADLAGLLFFEEVHRNPSSLLLHQMMLELIKFNGLSWSDALKLMPMAPTGATSAAISVNNTCQNSLKYHYDIRKSDKFSGTQLVKNLVNQESELFKRWLGFKGVDIENELESSILVDLLLNACKEWYNVDLKSSFISDENLKKQIDIGSINNHYKLSLTLDYDSLKYNMSITGFTNLAGIIGGLTKEDWVAVYNFFDQDDISPFILLILNNDTDEILRFLQKKEVTKLLEYKLSIWEIFDLYKENILDQIYTEGLKIVDFVREKDDDAALCEIIDFYKNNRKMFDRLLAQTEDDSGPLATEGYEDFIMKLNFISLRRHDEIESEDFSDPEEQEDSMDELINSHKKNESLFHYHSEDSQNVCSCSGESSDED